MSKTKPSPICYIGIPLQPNVRRTLELAGGAARTTRHHHHRQLHTTTATAHRKDGTVRSNAWLGAGLTGI